MAFSFTKLFGKADTTLKTEDTVEAIIEKIENDPYGVSDHNVLFAGLNELGGYFFFQTVIVGQLSVKVKNGAQLTFTGKDFELLLKSDMPEFESDHSDVKGRYITKIDFQVEESDIKKLENAKLKTIGLKVKKHDIVFSKYVGV
jgi:hypothetical protein